MRSPGRRLRVALVDMPFGSTRYPSIQLGLLQAILARRGIPATSHYLNLRFAARVGWDAYELLCDPWCRLIGEWIFARAAFGEDAPEGRRFLDAFALPIAVLGDELGWDSDRLLRLREQEAPAFIEECLESVPWDTYDVVAWGSVFEQNCAALALARRIKRRFPRLVTVFGGANFEDEMGLEYVRALPWIDYAVIGEGDEAFPALLERLAAGEDPAGMPGVARRGAEGVIFDKRGPMVEDLDDLPEPDYEDFFAAAADLGLPEAVIGLKVQIPFESARGCWWGAKHHCTFCGLNALGMAYRSKSPTRLLAGLDELARRYRRTAFFAVDNIMNPRYICEVFGTLAQRGAEYTFFYEAKANLTPEQLQTMARGGVRRMTAGIESLDMHLLNLMRKGVTPLQNIRLLKWALYYGIKVSWHLLVGFPGERPEDYAGQLETLRLIPHLPPPAAVVPVRLDRFSPYFSQPEAWRITNVRPDPAYACVYPPGLDLNRIAYFFEHDAPDTVPSEMHAPLHECHRLWRVAWNTGRRPFLTYRRDGERLVITDGRRPDDAPSTHVLEGPVALAYEFCSSTYHSMAAILDHLRRQGLEVDPGVLQRDVDVVTRHGLVLSLDGSYLSLALPAVE